MLAGTAKIFLRTIRAENYAVLRNAFIKEFDRQLTRPQIFAQLSNKQIKSNETAHQLVLNMQEMASHADIKEEELINFIIWFRTVYSKT